MRYLVLCLFILGCNTPTPQFSNVPVQRLQVGKSTFDVRIKGDHAQAIRLNSEWAPNWRHTAARFYTAFRRASGCDVAPDTMTGDQALMEARLNCGGQVFTPPVEADLKNIFCDVEGGKIGRPIWVDCRLQR